MAVGSSALASALSAGAESLVKPAKQRALMLQNVMPERRKIQHTVLARTGADGSCPYNERSMNQGRTPLV